MTQKTNQNPWTMDVRVRERNLKSGALTDKELEKNLAALPDLADQTEPFATSQPALAPPPAAIVSAPADDLDEEEDDLDDDEEEDEEVAVAASAPEEPVAPEAAPAAVSVDADPASSTDGEGEQP